MSSDFMRDRHPLVRRYFGKFLHRKFTIGDMSHLSSGRSTFRQSAPLSLRSARAPVPVPAMDLSSSRSTNFHQSASLSLRSAPAPAIDLSSAMGTLSLRTSLQLRRRR